MSNSWDCFDTLIARYYHQPISTFKMIAHKLQDPNFVEKRINAEKWCEKKTLQGIYTKLPKLDPELELITEIENTYPIKSNFDRVCDGDVIISDMYMSSEEVLRILRAHGLDKDVEVISTYGGKGQGYAWKKITTPNIVLHTGDNLHADIHMPRFYGMKASYYGNATLTNQEKTIERYCPMLAYWIKYIRLNDPYFIPQQQYIFNIGSLNYYYGIYWLIEINTKIYLLQQVDQGDGYLELYDKINNVIYKIYDTKIEIIDKDNQNTKSFEGQWTEMPVNTNRFDEKILWTEQCSYNIPLLIATSYSLPKNIVFSYRDCFYLKKIYDSIFNTDIPVLHSCRNAYYGPFNQEYIDYVLKLVQNKIIVDLHGSGWSAEAFFKNHMDSSKIQDVLFISEHAEEMKRNILLKNFSICFDHMFEDNPYINAHHHNRYSSMRGLRCCSGTMLEKFNIPPDLGPLVGWDGGPVRKRSEHDQKICRIFDSCVNCAVGVNTKYIKHMHNIDEEIIKVLMQKLNQDNYTNTVVHSLWEKSKNIRIQ